MTTPDSRPGPIDVTYIFVWNEIVGVNPRGSDGRSKVRIWSSEEWPDDQGTYQCFAYFAWGDFQADLACEYYPFDDAFSEMEFIVDRPIDDALNLFNIDIEFTDAFENDRFGSMMRPGEWEILDDNGNPFMVVEFRIGDWESPQVGYAYAKRALPGEEWYDVDLSREEKRLLSLDENAW